MEKRWPTYDLDAIKAAIGSAETLAITRSAFADALSMGFDRPVTWATLRRATRPFTVRYKGHEVLVDLPVYTRFPPESGYRFCFARRRPPTRRALYPNSSGIRVYYPDGDGESVHVGADMAPADEALRVLKERADGLPSLGTIRRIRHKLKLSQRAAGAVFGVGARAFDKYERSLIEPSGPTVQLLRLLDKHPELASELKAPEQ